MLSSLPATQTFCNITTTIMSASPDQTAVAAAHSFNKVLNQHKLSKSRRSGDADEGLKKLRRMILVEGIPSKVVRSNVAMDRPPFSDRFSCRILLFVLEYGKFSYGSMIFQRRHFYNMFLVVHVRFGRKSGMIPLGEIRRSPQWYQAQLCEGR